MESAQLPGRAIPRGLPSLHPNRSTANLGALLRCGSAADVWGQHRELAKGFLLHRATQLDGAINHPKLGNDLAYEFSVTEESDYRTLGNHDPHRLGHGTHVGCGDVPATESQGHVNLGGNGVEVAARREDDAIVTDHESAIQLRK